MADDELERLVQEQIDYYRARASEYDDGVPHEPDARAELVAALEALAPYGNVLELACGTGLSTAILARQAEHLTAVDVSEEMLALAARRVPKGVTFIEADLFSWAPGERYDLVFFSFWLSHVPPQRFEQFWTMVAGCLEPGGQVFFIDELPAVADREHRLDDAPAPAVERPLASGEHYRAIKVFYEPDVLEARLASLGWEISIRTAGWRFYYGSGGLAT